MSTTLPFDQQKFAAAYNDTGAYPRLSDVAALFSVTDRTVRNWAVMLRRLFDKDRLNEVPALISRSGYAATAKAPGEQHRTIETVVEGYEEPIEDLLQRVIAYNERYDEHLRQKACIDIKVGFEGAYGVVGLPDHHLNNIGTMIRRAFDDAQTIASHPRLFAVGIGDWIDNFIVGRLERERRKDVMSHSDSWRLMEHYVHILAPKLIAAISGNHNDWAKEAGGVDITKKMFEDLGLGRIFDNDEVRVRMTSPNGASFTHLARHKYRGNSRFNSVHAITVKILEDWQGEDVVWGGHIHVAGHVAMEKQWLGESKIVHGIQLASYKKHDSYAKREAFRQNVPFLTPMTVHVPETGEVVFFADMHQGIAYLDYLTRASS